MWEMDSNKSDSKVIVINSWVNGGIEQWGITRFEGKVLFNKFICVPGATDLGCVKSK